jgi:cytidylate kinase
VNKVIIAIDGHSSCGKSTLAKGIAHRLNIRYIDSGAMYRAVALHLINNSISIEDTASIVASLDDIDIQFKINDAAKSELFLNGHNVNQEIRSPKVAAIVSEVARIAEVRSKMVSLQREYGDAMSLVMDGRDIGSNVFPHADIKFFVTARIDIRAKRRWLELKDKDIESSLDEVRNNLKHRDHIDSTRKTHPLIKTNDAILIDNSDMTIDEQLDLALSHISKKSKL